MENLTLVELAEAITDGKTIELEGAKKEHWRESAWLREIFDRYEHYPDSVRIKPGPREYFQVTGLEGTYATLQCAQEAIALCKQKCSGTFGPVIRCTEVLE